MTVAATSAEPQPAVAFRPGMNRVTFTSEGDALVGNLFLPASYTEGTTLPLIIIGGAWLTVKEQMPNLYARRLANRGLAALTFDFRGFGESQGSPRHYESPVRKSADIANAAVFARELPVTEPERIGGLGICASGGYMARAIANGAPIAALVTVAAWLHDLAALGSFYGGAEGIAQRMALAKTAREKYERTGSVDQVPAYDPNDASAGMFFPLDYYASTERGAVPAWPNKLAVMSWTDWLTYDGLAPAPSVTVPSLIVHSDEAVFPDNARRFYAALRGPKDLFWTQGTQTDFYDKDPYVAKAVDVATAHFNRELSSDRQNGG